MNSDSRHLKVREEMVHKRVEGILMGISVLWIKYSEIILALQKTSFEMFQYSKT
jgi:hypothetical protein